MEDMKSDLPKWSVLTGYLYNPFKCQKKTWVSHSILQNQTRTKVVPSWESLVFFNSATQNKRSKYNSRQPYKSQSGCDSWDGNCSPRVTNVKSQRDPNSAPGSRLESWCTDLSPTVYLMLMCDADPSGLQGNFRALLWDVKNLYFPHQKK